MDGELGQFKELQGGADNRRQLCQLSNAITLLSGTLPSPKVLEGDLLIEQELTDFLLLLQQMMRGHRLLTFVSTVCAKDEESETRRNGIWASVFVFAAAMRPASLTMEQRQH